MKNMKFTNLARMIRNGLLVLVVSLITTTAVFAQANNANNSNVRTETTRVVERDNDTDWGWLGLLGLLGLAGLIPKKRTVEVQEFRDTQQNRPTSDTGTTQ
jgi:MYXO-CTERM domain-containing protein